MKASPNQLRILLIFMSAMFGTYCLIKELGDGGSPGLGIAMAGASLLIIATALASKPDTAKNRDEEK